MAYETLYNIIDNIKIVDDHVHLDFASTATDLRAQGVPDNGIFMMPGGYAHPSDRSNYSAGLRYLQDFHYMAYERIYGFSREEIDDPSKQEDLKKRYAEREADQPAVLSDIMEAAGIEYIMGVWDAAEKLKAMPQVGYVPLLDYLLYPFNNEGSLTDWGHMGFLERIIYNRSIFDGARMMERHSGEPAETFADYLAIVDKELAEWEKTDNVGYKFACVYVLGMDYGFRPSMEEAEAAWQGAKAGDKKAYRRLQEAVMWHLVVWAGKVGKALQIHCVPNNSAIKAMDEMGLQCFLSDPEAKKAKIVMLHAVSNFEKCMTLARLGPNMVMDTSGKFFAPHPHVLAHRLYDVLIYPAYWTKIMYGSDALSNNRVMWAMAHVTREALKIVLARMCDQGIISEEQGILIAKNILRNNAIRTYNLPLELA